MDSKKLPALMMPLLLASLGCDALTVRSYAGSVIELTLTGVSATTIPANQHLELWARTQYDDIVRVPGYTNLAEGTTAYGLMLRQAISLNDPCMLDGYYFHNDKGNLLTSPAAYPPSVTSGGVTQTDAEQAQQVIDRINQLTLAGTTGPLLAILPYDASIPPVVPATATPEERLTACDGFTKPNKVPNPLAYVGNPYQITGPLNGTVYGFVSFTSLTPPTNYDGYRIDTPLSLKNVREIFFTVENDTVDPKNLGPLFMTSTMTQGGIDVIHFELVHADPNGTASGTATLLVDLDEDPVQF